VLLALVLGVQRLGALLALLGLQRAKSSEDVVGYFPPGVLEQEDWVCVSMEDWENALGWESG
jgi:hypothetical protein